MLTEQIAKGILRLKVPFEDLYTAVFFVECEDGVSVIDSATTSSDVDTVILPALRELSVIPTRLLLTHSHGDHAGGAKRLLEHYPDMTVHTLEPLSLPRFIPLCDGDTLGGTLQMIALLGHSKYSVGYLHMPTNTLLSGDCLQLAGVGKYVNGIRYPEPYLRSIERLKQMDIQRIVASHEYAPLGSTAEGREGVLAYLDECERICLAQPK